MFFVDFLLKISGFVFFFLIATFLSFFYLKVSKLKFLYVFEDSRFFGKTATTANEHRLQRF